LKISGVAMHKFRQNTATFWGDFFTNTSGHPAWFLPTTRLEPRAGP
jgi:hypothetical protein